ncbi:ATP phosphoribosyltransferase [Neomoorella thermoacetica]|uniref:ATP phosphoribosyltransferase n=2 Tax=Neomoorella thermoacetica TaxID=1525 RepID=HIS1_MOOTA|nr:ATP phosphoribosyltransferase [Moorella thermoacetica]Q2RGV7.1 RecName: Full=ATP phosphoribosyltransferase; Short=ATP-PRT; Short=ATP-PRTase [Moorella thermoacetica ATCC 39073]AKX94867.1 ATP phosphoribosyltransferase [Moorella thermoacetica]AKX97497.1 ATP phosphoribosyltransferase [Moorella thermoacetica]AOQ24999.1 ATP phosphoribosyltransferase [Moorella thermoacetica]OIQ11167.1 ATP phosphoribosyltransferase [Moorella thermoacetica]OIQ54757.1 ATP phosphoribosyltransferase [Moorella thermoac
MVTNLLTLALPKGKLGQDALQLLQAAGLPVEGVATEARQLTFTFPAPGIRYLICRPTDVPTYVEYGAADLGIVGKDTLAEAGADVFELVDLGFGYCRFVVAAPRERWEEAGRSLENLLAGSRRVATKFPRVAASFFQERGLPVEIIKLHGNIELAPRAGLADLIVDIVSTGRTLKENDLVEVAPIFSSTARLIANRVSYRINYRRLTSVVEALKRAAGQGGEKIATTN